MTNMHSMPALASGSDVDNERAPAALRGIADALSQPLFAISANADAISRLASRQPTDLSEIRAALAEMTNEAQRLARLLAAAQGHLDSLESGVREGS